MIEVAAKIRRTEVFISVAPRPRGSCSWGPGGWSPCPRLKIKKVFLSFPIEEVENQKKFQVLGNPVRKCFLQNREKERENIAEYILYMWQMEDLVRGNNMDLSKVLSSIFIGKESEEELLTKATKIHPDQDFPALDD